MMSKRLKRKKPWSEVWWSKQMWTHVFWRIVLAEIIARLFWAAVRSAHAARNWCWRGIRLEQNPFSRIFKVKKRFPTSFGMKPRHWTLKNNQGDPTKPIQPKGDPPLNFSMRPGRSCSTSPAWRWPTTDAVAFPMHCPLQRRGPLAKLPMMLSVFGYLTIFKVIGHDLSHLVLDPSDMIYPLMIFEQGGTMGMSEDGVYVGIHGYPMNKMLWFCSRKGNLVVFTVFFGLTPFQTSHTWLDSWSYKVVPTSCVCCFVKPN